MTRSADSYLIPDILLKGYNMVLPFSSDSSTPYSIAQQYWGSDYSLAERHHQVDLGLAQGANVFRLFGSVNVVTSGELTLAEYCNRQVAFVDYIASKGAFYYPTGFDGIGFDGATPTTADATTVLSAVCDALSPYTAHIIGFDICNENPGWTISRPTLIPTLRAHLDVPYTSDCPEGANGIASTTTRTQLRTAGVDFWDYHFYGTLNVSDFDALLAEDTRPVLIGEFGRQANSGSSFVTDRFSLVATILDRIVGGRGLAGSLVWSLKDSFGAAVDTVDNWGAYRTDDSRRALLADAFALLPGGGLLGAAPAFSGAYRMVDDQPEAAGLYDAAGAARGLFRALA